MGKTKRNYSRFYAIAKSKGIDLALYKKDLVAQFTDGRTTSLKDMKEDEYTQMCDCLQYDRKRYETDADFQSRRRKARSAVLNRIQRLGIDTTDFSKVDNFCLDRRIAGKVFGSLTIDELNALVPKLEAMIRKPRKEKAAVQSVPEGPDPLLYLKYFKPNSHPKYLN